MRKRAAAARILHAALAAAAIGAASAPAPSRAHDPRVQVVDACVPITVETRRIGGRRVERVWGEPTTVEFTSGMAIDADGALRAYHPDDVSGLDALVHAGAPGGWWGVATHDGTPAGEPIVQGESAPAPGFYVSQTSLVDPSRPRDDPARYVDSAAVPYVALHEVFVRELGCRLGDFAWVVHTDANGDQHASAAIFADVVAPHLPVGEGSIALAERLALPASPRSGGTYRDSVDYVLFCGSGNGAPRTVAEIDAEGARLAAQRRARNAVACPRR
jgi:hypothetical protein